MTKKILILGGGFAGVEAAIKLSKYDYDITLVSNRNYLFVYPLSIWVPVHKKSFENVKISLSSLQKKYKFNLIIDEVIDISPRHNQVVLKNSKLQYDYLVIAMGMEKSHIPGIEHTHSICGKPDEAIIIKNKLDELIAKGSGTITVGFGSNPKDPSATAVRGGPAFELVFNISNYLRKKKVRDNFKLIFFAPMNEPGKKMGDNVLKKLKIFFKHYNIAGYTGRKIEQFKEDSILFEDGSEINSDLTIFVPSGTGHKVLKTANLRLNEAGFVKINKHCRADRTENVFVAGDSAALMGPKWVAKQGHLADIMGNVAAYNIHHTILGSSHRKKFTKHLSITCLMDSGNGAAFVYRNSKVNRIIPMPVFGHWLKKAWGYYYLNSKLGRIPKLPFM